eukprot:TRINITY_DN3044_c0_g1_i1.p1 TRINITY_DN3044_c0_g1~~TRINITY_DN3044_c0_g1_i1.p1  ORF type:complete len:113 (-),score=32.12 TRINITY_DN3044_c0_g1_i1:107-445(-)
MSSSPIITILALLLQISLSSAIWCYDCESSKDFSCTDNMDAIEGSAFLSNCSSVYEAKYCIAMRGVYEGKLGTKRFCSSRNWGTYCEYIRRPGDSRDYRSCISTCSSYACNL